MFGQVEVPEAGAGGDDIEEEEDTPHSGGGVQGTQEGRSAVEFLIEGGGRSAWQMVGDSKM